MFSPVSVRLSVIKIVEKFPAISMKRCRIIDYFYEKDLLNFGVDLLKAADW